MATQFDNMSTLERRILESSNARNLGDARSEWVRIGTERKAKSTKLVCGHWLKNIVVLENRKNGSIMRIGKACADIALPVPHIVWESVKITLETPGGLLSSFQIKWLFEKRFMTGWEQDFYTNIQKPYKLSSRQNEIKEGINILIRNKMKKAGV